MSARAISIGELLRGRRLESRQAAPGDASIALAGTQ